MSYNFPFFVQITQNPMYHICQLGVFSAGTCLNATVLVQCTRVAQQYTQKVIADLGQCQGVHVLEYSAYNSFSPPG